MSINFPNRLNVSPTNSYDMLFSNLQFPTNKNLNLKKVSFEPQCELEIK